ncbi:MAG: hypothetical protein VKL39_10515 [Leptolyngbyaceae bacterium]|nr:hypothetical protein [Leptolyngbyaceae bacterium]
MSSPVQQLALVDCNNFYVSCERVFRPPKFDTSKPISAVDAIAALALQGLARARVEFL